MWFEMAAVGLDFVDRAPFSLEFCAVANATPERVFDLFASAAHDGEWFPLYREGHWTSPPPHGEGSTREIQLVGLGVRERYEVLERARRIVVIVLSSTLPLARAMAEELVFEPMGPDKTKITWRIVYAPTPLLRLVHPIARLVFGELFGVATRNLARYASDHPA